jgi:hypothetical protein
MRIDILFGMGNIRSNGDHGSWQAFVQSQFGRVVNLNHYGWKVMVPHFFPNEFGRFLGPRNVAHQNFLGSSDD